MKSESPGIKAARLLRYESLRYEFRFRDLEQRQLATQAAERAGAKSLNAWILMVVTSAARRELSQCD
jgi:predicted HicB family RNase H-like nuclease